MHDGIDIIRRGWRIVEHDVGDGDLLDLAVMVVGCSAQHPRPRSVEHRQPAEGHLGPELLRDPDGHVGDDEEAEEVRKAALEFMISLSEARPMMVKRVDGWTQILVRACLEGMGEIEDDPDWDTVEARDVQML